MTVLTDNGREYLDDLAYGRVDTPINTIAIGTGGGPESEDDEELANEVFRATTDDAIVEFTKVAGTLSSTYVSIAVRGGLEVPVETEITEVGVFAGDELIYRDVRNPVRVGNGVEATFRIRLTTVEL